MIETRRLKNILIFIQTILSFVLSRKIIYIYIRYIIYYILYINNKYTYIYYIYIYISAVATGGPGLPPPQ